LRTGVGRLPQPVHGCPTQGPSTIRPLPVYAWGGLSRSRNNGLVRANIKAQHARVAAMHNLVVSITLVGALNLRFLRMGSRTSALDIGHVLPSRTLPYDPTRQLKKKLTARLCGAAPQRVATWICALRDSLPLFLLQTRF